ncbi:radical SAM protein [Actinoplanes sp. NPDC049596]|uniref:radical SAM protein n=1 Tax=unclassified Actinoplanes TaxID=2626549 RepID=UPI0034459967
MPAVGTWLRRVRRRDGVRLRPEDFGAVAYVAAIDRFVALDHAAAAFVAGLGPRGTAVDHAREPMAARLAAAGLIEPVADRPLAGRSLIGDFTEMPPLGDPLVVNVFATAWCPLRCRYCHADDLMQPFRADPGDIERVAATAAAVPAMVAVVTGGDPILDPARTQRLIARLAETKAIVVDTSGAGDITPLIPLLKQVQGHLRVSLDSAGAALHDRLRPINPRLLPRGTSSHEQAWATIQHAVTADIGTTVQTVVSRANQREDELIALARKLVGAGVRNWVLHLAVAAGKAAQGPGRQLLPTDDARAVVDRLVARLETEDEFRPLRVRVTATNARPNAVLLVGSQGELYVERGPTGKVQLASAAHDTDEVRRLFRTNVDLQAHADRYLGGTAPI